MPINKKSLVFLSLILAVFLSAYFWAKHSHPAESLRKNPDYTLVFLGDSMTEYLGNFEQLREYLKDYFPGKKFLLLNYGFSSTNVLSAQDRIEKDSTHSGRIFEPVNNIPFNLIFIESFGYNPLSDYPLSDGLNKQTEALDKMVATLSKKHPKSSIIFVATIAPNRKRFGEGLVNLTADERRKWADERSAYIKNHIAYAKVHNIPLINIYEKSLGEDGSGNTDYINTKDFIHPSTEGIYFISREIAKFISENKLLNN